MSPPPSTPQIAELLGVSRASAYRIAKECEHVRIGRLVRVHEDALRRFLEERTQRPSWSPTSRFSPARRKPIADNMSWYRPGRRRNAIVR